MPVNVCCCGVAAETKPDPARCRGYALYVTRDYLDAFLEHPHLSQWAAERKLCLILWDSARIPRIVIGDSWDSNSTRMADRSDMTERIYAYQSTVRLARHCALLIFSSHWLLSSRSGCAVHTLTSCGSHAPAF